jgi:hypothetical protein
MGLAPGCLSVTLFTASMWDVLGVAPRFGRVFTVDEDLAGNDDVVVLSHGRRGRLLPARPSRERGESTDRAAV